MDELDLLLEELALGSKDNIPTENFGEPTENVNASSCSNVYSSLPAPVAATNRDISPTKELESILEDLLGLADQHQEPKESPPPLAKKLSLKKREETIHEENRDVQPALSKKTDTIDELLGGLSSDLEKIGVKTTAKGHCAACQKIIVGKIITALGETWHPEHFVCVMCKMELSAVGFFERDGRPYCSKDYHELFSPRCAYCKGPILQNILNALDQTWHPEHFFCSHCGDLFGSEVLWLWRSGEGELPDCGQWDLASRVLCLCRLSDSILRWTFLGAGGTILVPFAFPLSTGDSVWQLWGAHHRTLHLSPVPQVSPRAFCVCLLPAPAEPGNL
ncbi:leupaxin isoform X2 [Eucyclogobius newberryi]|uniref:leupaxin isoform X2 n=1 Tax=Eucyclogobius newberryi TaxID=166745 RepID=UPI003B5C01AF